MSWTRFLTAVATLGVDGEGGAARQRQPRRPVGGTVHDVARVKEVSLGKTPAPSELFEGVAAPLERPSELLFVSSGVGAIRWMLANLD